MPDPTAENEPELLTITEAADVLRAPVATLRYWRHLGTGPNSFRRGRRVLYRRADLRTWIDAQADQSPRRLDLVLQPHIPGFPAGVVAAAGSGLVSAAPA